VSESAGRASFAVGHWTDPEARTGCTVLLFDRLVPAVVDVRGGAPGTRETDLLSSERLVGQADAILLTGGSAFGLAAADGVMKYLRERNRGFQTAAGPVPIVPAAVLFDLGVGSPVSPSAENGYAACEAALPLGESPRGSIGAGTGATIRKLWPDKPPRPGGFGWSTVDATEQARVHALCAVNAVGDVAGAEWTDARPTLLGHPVDQDNRTSTTLVAVIVEGDADHRTLRRIAVSAHDAMARAIVPCHTLWDGDVVFVAQTGTVGEVSQMDALRLSIAAELAVESAIRSAIPGA
jgi:L-aminopeptidase/D-esterase-like protein